MYSEVLESIKKIEKDIEELKKQLKVEEELKKPLINDIKFYGEEYLCNNVISFPYQDKWWTKYEYGDKVTIRTAPLGPIYQFTTLLKYLTNSNYIIQLSTFNPDYFGDMVIIMIKS